MNSSNAAITSNRTTPTTILAAGRELSCDTRATMLNNNMLVLGPSGSGKTRHVLMPNLLQMGSSFLVLDTKGQFHREVGPILARHGYDVQIINFADLADNAAYRDAIGYNPLAHVRRDPVTGRPNQQDIFSMSRTLCLGEEQSEPFWDGLAANYLSCCIAYVLEQLPPAEQTLRSVARLVEEFTTGGFERLMKELEVADPYSYALAIWRRAPVRQSPVTKNSDNTYSTILGIIAEKVMCLAFDTACALYEMPRQVDFARMGHERVALFVTMSDIDHTLEPLTNLFIAQALQELMREADHCDEGRLPVPVRLMLDDFANLRTPDFADAISVLHSREIWCTLSLQTISQLEHRYGAAAAQSIVGNCDEQLVLAFQDITTARTFADRANRLPSSLLATPLDRMWLFVRGRPGEEVRRYELTDHPLYQEMLDEQRHQTMRNPDRREAA